MPKITTGLRTPRAVSTAGRGVCGVPIQQVLVPQRFPMHSPKGAVRESCRWQDTQKWAAFCSPCLALAWAAGIGKLKDL